MQIKILRNLGRGLPPFTEGQVADVDEQTAESLVKKGLAEVVIQAVPPQPMRAGPTKDEKKKADA